MAYAWVHLISGAQVTIDWVAPCLGLSAILLEFVLRGFRKDIPLYRRHLLIFTLLCVVPICFEHWTSVGTFLWRRIYEGAWITLALSLMTLPWLRGRRLNGLGWRKGLTRRNDPSRPLILVADPHWDLELTGLAEATSAWPQADWLFLGDLFEIWIGIPGMERDAQRDFLGWVDERRRSGRWVGLWMGNREMFLDSIAPHFDLIGEGTGGELPEEGLSWEHGDLINGKQWAYRLFYLVSRSGPTWLFAKVLPASYARALARTIERSMRRPTPDHCACFPMEAFQNAARRAGGTTFVTGHFHISETAGKGIALPWAHEGRFMVWRNGQVEHLG
jgi:UDP-2,3-diacylglucosamine pyrophosphatase LpxH